MLYWLFSINLSVRSLWFPINICPYFWTQHSLLFHTKTSFLKTFLKFYHYFPRNQAYYKYHHRAYWREDLHVDDPYVTSSKIHDWILSHLKRLIFVEFLSVYSICNNRKEAVSWWTLTWNYCKIEEGLSRKYHHYRWFDDWVFSSFKESISCLYQTIRLLTIRTSPRGSSISISVLHPLLDSQVSNRHGQAQYHFLVCFNHGLQFWLSFIQPLCLQPWYTVSYSPRIISTIFVILWTLKIGIVSLESQLGL